MLEDNRRKKRFILALCIGVVILTDLFYVLMTPQTSQDKQTSMNPPATMQPVIFTQPNLTVLGEHMTLNEFPDTIRVHYPFLIVGTPEDATRTSSVYDLAQGKRIAIYSQVVLDYVNRNVLSSDGKTTYLNKKELGINCLQGFIQDNDMVYCLSPQENDPLHNKLVSINPQTLEKKDVFSSDKLINTFTVINGTLYISEVDTATGKSYIRVGQSETEIPTQADIIYPINKKVYYATFKSSSLGREAQQYELNTSNGGLTTKLTERGKSSFNKCDERSMRLPLNDPNHLKNKVLVVIYVFRTLPAYYFEDIQSAYPERRKIQYIVNNLIQDGLIKRKSSLRTRIQFLLLTKKGHDFVTTYIFEDTEGPFYQYRTARFARLSDSDHRFMNFFYIWDWVGKHTDLLNTGIRIYEDSNRNNCRLKFVYGGDTIVLYPDILILLPDTEKGKLFYKATIVETDTGTETSGTLFRKIVEYSAFASKGLQQGFISQAELIFTLHSKNRSTRVLPNIIKQAKTYNSTLKVKDVKARELLQSFDETGVKIRFSIVNTTRKPATEIYTSIPYDFRKELLKKNPSWQY